MPQVRKAAPEDAIVMGRIHVEAWRVGYRGQMPDDYLDGLSADHRGQQWRHALEAGGGDGQGVIGGHQATVLVIEGDGGEVLGMAAVGADREHHESGVGELWMINMDPAVWGLGLGRQLLGQATEELGKAGYRQAILWVLDINSRARRFYERDSWWRDGSEKLEALGTHSLREVRYRRDL